MTELLIDRFLPAFDTTVVEHTVVEADVATTWSALRRLDLMEVHTPLMDAAFLARDLPARVAAWAARARAPAQSPPALTLFGEGPGLEGWLRLGDVDEREVVVGAVGRFWKPEIEWYDVSAMTPEQFAAFGEVGWGRIAANISLLPYGETRTLASYEARTATPDPDSARRFARYWALVRPFVGHVMRATLASLRAEAAAPADRAPAAA